LEASSSDSDEEMPNMSFQKTDVLGPNPKKMSLSSQSPKQEVSSENDSSEKE
jgi:hypothetical protein